MSIIEKSGTTGGYKIRNQGDVLVSHELQTRENCG